MDQQQELRLTCVNRRLWTSAVLTFVSVLGVMLVPALKAQQAPQLTAAEEYVLRQAERGNEADMERLPPEKRVLRNDFVARLITGGYRNPEMERRGVSIVHAEFTEPLVVSSAAVPFRVWLKACEFQRGVDFSYTRFARDLSLEGSRFGAATAQPASTTDTQAFFAGMKVEGTADFSHTAFYVPADFTYAEFGTDLLFDYADYGSEQAADFETIKIKGPVFFRHDRFAGTLNLQDADLFELFIEDLASDTLGLNTTQMHIERGTSIKNIRLNWWRGRFMIAKGEFVLDGVTSAGPVDLAHSQVQHLSIIGFDEWLKMKPGTLSLEGLSFDSVDIGNTNIEPPAAKMLELINSDRCPFSPQPYVQLESLLRAHGNPQSADRVYISMRRRQRQKLSWINRPWDWLLDETLRYGKQPWRAAFGASFLVLVGVLVFAPSRMEWKDSKETPTKYNRFWYSVDQLAPVIDLEFAKKWVPKRDHGITYNYALFQRIAGWILIPLIVGAITGIIK